jgi:hypothetical protein
MRRPPAPHGGRNRRRLALAAALAESVHLDDGVGLGEAACRGNLFEARGDVGTEEFGRGSALSADEMEVARAPRRRIVAGAAVAEIHLVRHAGVDHPLQRAVDGGAADLRMLTPHGGEELVGADVPLLLQEHVEDAIALGRAVRSELHPYQLMPGSSAAGARSPR